MNLLKSKKGKPWHNSIACLPFQPGWHLSTTNFATPLYSSRQGSQPLPIAGGTKYGAKSRDIDDDPQYCPSKVKPPHAISKEPDAVDKRCRSTLASYVVGRGVTNLVNLKGRTHLISAWDADTMQ